MPSTKGLFFSDDKGYIAHVQINTVDKNKSKYTVKQYSDTHKARLIHDIIGRPSTADYVKYIENYLIPNCPIMKEDIVREEDNLESNVGIIKGKMTWKTPERVSNTLDNLPNGMLEEHSDVTIAIDIMYINEIPFMMTTS